MVCSLRRSVSLEPFPSGPSRSAPRGLQEQPHPLPTAPLGRPAGDGHRPGRMSRVLQDELLKIKRHARHGGGDHMLSKRTVVGYLQSLTASFSTPSARTS
jgi:hypothetical protein